MKSFQVSAGERSIRASVWPSNTSTTSLVAQAWHGRSNRLVRVREAAYAQVACDTYGKELFCTVLVMDRDSSNPKCPFLM